MEMPDGKNLRAFVPWAYDYIVGIWWLAAFGVVFIRGDEITTWIKTADAWAIASPNVHVPEFAVNAAIVAFLVTLPFCVSLATYPVVLLFANQLLRLQRRIVNRHQLASDIPPAVRRAMSWSPTEALLRLGKVDASTARTLSLRYQHAYLRLGTMIPTAIVTYWVAHAVCRRFLIDSAATSVGAVIAVALLIILIWDANRSYDLFLRDLEAMRRLSASSNPRGPRPGDSLVGPT